MSNKIHLKTWVFFFFLFFLKDHPPFSAKDGFDCRGESKLRAKNVLTCLFQKLGDNGEWCTEFQKKKGRVGFRVHKWPLKSM